MQEFVSYHLETMIGGTWGVVRRVVAYHGNGSGQAYENSERIGKLLSYADARALLARLRVDE